MATQKKVIGKLPVARGEYVEGTSYGKYNLVTKYGSTYMSKEDNNNTSPATLSDSGKVIVNTEKWETYADASLSYESGQKIANTGVEDYPVFSSSEDYLSGDIVNYQGKLYKFNSAHSAGAWIGTDASVITMKQDLDEKLTELENKISKGENLIQIVGGELSINIEVPYNDLTLPFTIKKGTILKSINEYSGLFIYKGGESYVTVREYPHKVTFDTNIVRGSEIGDIILSIEERYYPKTDIDTKFSDIDSEISENLNQIVGGDLSINITTEYADIMLPYILKRGAIIDSINSEYDGKLIVKQNNSFITIDNYPYTLTDDCDIIRGSVVGDITISFNKMFCTEENLLEQISDIKPQLILDKNLSNQYAPDIYKGDELEPGTYTIIVDPLSSGIESFYLNGYINNKRTDYIVPPSAVGDSIKFKTKASYDQLGLVLDKKPTSEYNVKLYRGADLVSNVDYLTNNLLRDKTNVTYKIITLSSTPSVYEWLTQEPLEAGEYEIIVLEKTAKISGYQIVAYNEDNTSYNVLSSSLIGQSVKIVLPKKSFKTRINFQNTVVQAGDIIVNFYRKSYDITKDVDLIKKYNPASYLRTPGDFLKVYKSNMYDCTTTVYSGDSIFGSGFGDAINNYEQPPRLCNMLGFTRSLYEHWNKGKTINYRNVQHSDWSFTGNKEFVKIGSAPYGSEKVVKLSDGATAEISFTNAKKMIIFYQKGRSGTSYATGQLTMQISTNDGTSYSSMSDIVKGRTTKKGFGDVKVYDAAVDTINTSFTDELGYSVMGNDTANNRYSCYGKEVYNGLSESETYKVKITSQGETYIWGIAYTTEDVIHLVYNCSKPGFNWEQLCQSFWADIIETEADNVILEAPMYHDRTEKNVLDGTDALFSLYEKYRINCVLCSCPPGGVIITGSTATILGDDNASSYWPGEQFYTYYNQNRYLYFKTPLSDKNASPDRFEKYKCIIDNVEYEVEVVQSVADKNVNYVSVVVPKNFPKEIKDITFTKSVSSSNTTLSEFVCSAVDERISMEEHRDVILQQARKYGYLFVDLLESFRDIAKQVGEDLDTEYWDMDENHPLHSTVLSAAQNALQYPDLNKWYLEGKPFPMNFMSNFFSISDGHHLQYNAQAAIWEFLKNKVFVE